MDVRAERIKQEAIYMIETNETVRELAKKFNISKSTIHNDLRKKLKNLDYELYKKVDEILNSHVRERHIRGGESTKNKYKNKS